MSIWSYALISFNSRAGVHNKDPTVWLDGARLPPKVCLQVLKKYLKEMAKSMSAKVS